MKNLNKPRCPHKRTSIIAIISALAIIGMSGCVHKDVQRADTDSNAPPNITQDVTTVCSTVPVTTSSITTVFTRTQTTTADTSTAETNVSTTMTAMMTTSADMTNITETDIHIEYEHDNESEIVDFETYTEPVYEDTSYLPITESERVMLCNLVGREYGSDYVPVAEKAKVVAVVMNRVNSPLFPNTIYEVLTQPYQFSGYIASDVYSYQVTDSVIESIDYYFNHTEEFGNWLYFEGNGTWNYFS